MSRIRTCGKRCHTAKRKLCKCWCKGHFHGEPGTINREDLAADFATLLLEELNYDQSKMRYIPTIVQTEFA